VKRENQSLSIVDAGSPARDAENDMGEGERKVPWRPAGIEMEGAAGRQRLAGFDRCGRAPATETVIETIPVSHAGAQRPGATRPRTPLLPPHRKSHRQLPFQLAQ
jgi:hypothetical protein